MTKRDGDTANERAVSPDRAHILVVDDDADMRLLLSTCLASAGFRVTEAGDGDVMDACLAQADVDLQCVLDGPGC